MLIQTLVSIPVGSPESSTLHTQNQHRWLAFFFLSRIGHEVETENIYTLRYKQEAQWHKHDLIYNEQCCAMLVRLIDTGPRQGRLTNVKNMKL